MKRRTTLLLILCMIILAACGKRPEAATIVTASPWPSHAPGATPYVRLQAETGTMPNTETHQGPVEYSESYEDIIRKLYAEDGNYYGKDWEMQMFRELPQDEPYSFVVRTDAMLQGADTLDDHIALAGVEWLYADESGEGWELISQYLQNNISLDEMLTGIDRKVQMMLLEGN